MNPKRYLSILILLITLSLSSLCVHADTLSDIQQISEGTELIASGTFDQEHETLWLLFDNNQVVILLRDENLPDIFGLDAGGWMTLAPDADVNFLPDYDKNFSIEAYPHTCDHVYQKETIQIADAENDGLDIYTCTKCGHQYSITTYYINLDVKYILTTQINGETVEIEITQDQLDHIQIIVGIEYGLVKLSKTSRPSSVVRISNILRMRVSAKRSLARAVYALQPEFAAQESNYDDYIREEIGTITATQEGTAYLDLSFEDGTTQTLTFIAINAESSDGNDDSSQKPDPDITNPDTPCGPAAEETDPDTSGVTDPGTTAAGSSDSDKPQTSTQPAAPDHTNMQVPSASQVPADTPASSGNPNTPADHAECPIDPGYVNPSASKPNDTAAILPKAGTRFTLKGASYKITAVGKTAALQQITKKNLSSFQVPTSVTYKGVSYRVTEVSARAFADMKKLTNVVIGKNVTKIGSKVFLRCPKLKTIRFNCTKLTRSKIHKQVFAGITNKKTVSIKLIKKMSSKTKKYLTSLASGIGTVSIIK